jgi:hypothetical protein
MGLLVGWPEDPVDGMDQLLPSIGLKAQLFSASGSQPIIAGFAIVL